LFVVLVEELRANLLDLLQLLFVLLAFLLGLVADLVSGASDD
jgi:hypothetical protein